MSSRIMEESDYEMEIAELRAINGELLRALQMMLALNGSEAAKTQARIAIVRATPCGEFHLPSPVLHQGRNSQHVLKAEGESPDATDRENCANASPDGGPMGVGQAAAAAPGGGVDACAATSNKPITERPVCTYANGCDCDVPRPLPQGNKAWHCPKQKEHAAKVWSSVSVEGRNMP